MSTLVTYELKDIIDLLPHRPPFLFVDRVTRLDPDRLIVAERLLRHEEPHFAGHFPGLPIMPGVLISEALAQTSGLLLGLSRKLAAGQAPASPPIFYLAKQTMKYTHPARPGEVLVLRSSADKQFGSLYLFNVEACVGRRLVASGSLTLANTSGAQP